MRSAILVVLAALSACCLTSGNRESNYEAVEGTALITEVRKSDYDPLPGKVTFMDVYFDFIPSDPAAPARYRHPRFRDTHVRLFVNSRGNLLQGWVDGKGIRKGKRYPARRYEKKGGYGSSPPVFFEVHEFETKKP